MAKQQNSQRGMWFVLAVAGITFSALSSPVVAEETLPLETEVTAPAPQAATMSPRELKQLRRAAKKGQLSAEEVAKLIESIPEDHPMRADLRQIASAPVPDGFSAQQWLQLSMKFDFRGAGKGSARADIE